MPQVVGYVEWPLLEGVEDPEGLLRNAKETVEGFNKAARQNFPRATATMVAVTAVTGLVLGRVILDIINMVR